jgi:undecaprenyl-diphosphatase
VTELDLRLAEHANGFAVRHDGVEDVASAYASGSEMLFGAGVVVLIIVGVLLQRRSLVRAGVLAVVASGTALAVASVLARLVDRPRPFFAQSEIHLFVTHAADPGFPSDHATAAFAIAGVLLLVLGPRMLLVLGAAIALAAARVVVGLHYPGDVLAGAVLGSTMAVLVVTLARRWAPRVTWWLPGRLRPY